jgi:hypothetical protein
MSPTAQRTAPFSRRRRDQTLETWREAASFVADRWKVFLEAEPESRTWAFASFVAALDAEEVAADEVAWMSSPVAA